MSLFPKIKEIYYRGRYFGTKLCNVELYESYSEGPRFEFQTWGTGCLKIVIAFIQLHRTLKRIITTYIPILSSSSRVITPSSSLSQRNSAVDTDSQNNNRTTNIA